jgi:ferredoxin
MPKVEIVGFGAVEVPAGTRLVNAILAAGVDIGHRCGGYAACTTCRVAFHEGEPRRMTLAEREKLADVKLLGQVRLSCQVPVEDDMRVRPLMLVSEQEWSDGGPPPEEQITPEPEWTGP